MIYFVFIYVSIKSGKLIHSQKDTWNCFAGGKDRFLIFCFCSFIFISVACICVLVAVCEGCGFRAIMS